MQNERFVVAVVDDDIRILESLHDLLESAGYCVRKFTDAASFLASDLSIVDCLITDIGMTGIDGFELLQLIGGSKCQIPTFVITGRHEAEDEDRAAALNAKQLFRKPFSTQRLLAEVRGVLRERIDGG